MARQRGKSGEHRGGPKKHAMPMVRSVERAARILDLLYRAPEGKRLADLSEELGLPKTTVLRLLRTLVAVGVLERDERADRFHRNPRTWLAMACEVPRLKSTTETVQSVLRRLEQRTGMFVSLALPDVERGAMMLIDWAVPMAALGMRGRERLTVPVHATAVGQAYLASLPPAQVSGFIRGKLHRFTGHTITSRRRLMEELAQVRKRGYALCRGTYTAGRFAVAVPARDAMGRAAAAISVGGPMELLTEANIQRWLPSMRTASEDLSRLLQAAPLDADVGKGGKAR